MKIISNFVEHYLRYAMRYNITFNNVAKSAWLKTISESMKMDYKQGDAVLMLFPDIDKNKIYPEHIVTLACFIEYLYRRGVAPSVSSNDVVGQYLYNDLELWKYWRGQQNYAPAASDNILNLWRFVEVEKDLHGKRISEYLKQRFFRNKDLSAVEVGLTESFYNISDHSEAQGNAFCFLYYNKDTEKLNVAVCDFGIGIPNCVRKVLPALNDAQAIAKAIEPRFTCQSADHNAGLGLGNIMDSCFENDYFWIISGWAAMVANEGKKKYYRMPTEFKGTLLFYNISLSHFDDEEIIDNFGW